MTTIAGKILEVMKVIPKIHINDALIEQKLISKTEYEVTEAKEKTTSQGVVWQFVTVACRLTIIDVESDEVIVNIALGSGMDVGDQAIAKAQVMARKYAWMAAFPIDITDDGIPSVTVPEPEFVGTPPENKIVTEISGLWKSKGWDPIELQPYVIKRFGHPLEELNLAEFEVLKTELENYRGGN